MSKGFWMLLTLIIGAILPIQAGLNARLAKQIEGPVFASLISFLVGTISIALYILLTRQTISIAGLKSAPLHLYIGGFLGAIYVTAIVFIFPRIGPALTFGLIVAGQMIISILMDHFNVMVAQPHPVNLYRAAGVVLIVAGVILIRKF